MPERKKITTTISKSGMKRLEELKSLTGLNKGFLIDLAVKSLKIPKNMLR